MAPKIAVAGSKTTTYECIRQLLRDGFHLDLLVTLAPEQGEEYQVAGYMDLRIFAKDQGIPVYHPKTYSLKHEDDCKALLPKGIDLLLVMGWQRLIPEWWLKSLRLGAFGMHGSPEPLPRGRGRSPMNWALLQGKTSFMTCLFKYDEGVDSGSIVGIQKFDITPWDDPDTLHMKNRIALNRLLKHQLPGILSGNVILIPQRQDIEPTYFPKRTAEDGRINWQDQTMGDLFNHIRCQTRPFPGAFSHLDGSPEKFYFWRAHPFDGHLIYYGEKPGTIVEVFYDESFLVAVWDGAVRVYDYISPEKKAPKVGKVFYTYPLDKANE